MRDLKPEDPHAPKILLHNVYGWFDRAERGVYVLTDAGHAALKRWPQQPMEWIRRRSYAMTITQGDTGDEMIVVTGSMTAREVFLR